jgi:hypothetical protein
MAGTVDLDPWVHIVESLAERPRMFVSAVRYDVFCALVVGFGIGRDDGVFIAFTDWLADRQVAHKNYGMPSMVLAEAGVRQLGELGQRAELSSDEDAAARAALIALLREFLTESAAAAREREGGVEPEA